MVGMPWQAFCSTWQARGTPAEKSFEGLELTSRVQDTKGGWLAVCCGKVCPHLVLPGLCSHAQATLDIPLNLSTEFTLG
jgi:hypothetical protein